MISQKSCWRLQCFKEKKKPFFVQFWNFETSVINYKLNCPIESYRFFLPSREKKDDGLVGFPNGCGACRAGESGLSFFFLQRHLHPSGLDSGLSLLSLPDLDIFYTCFLFLLADRIPPFSPPTSWYGGAGEL